MRMQATNTYGYPSEANGAIASSTRERPARLLNEAAVAESGGRGNQAPRSLARSGETRDNGSHALIYLRERPSYI